MQCCRDKLTMSETEVKQANKKKGGRYSAKERKIRRQKVAELFFEKGYDGLTMSRMLNVNRNTITNDLKVCFSQLKNEYNDFDAGTLCMTQFHRMEIQRRRLVDFLFKNLEFRDRLTLERMISDIENRIMQTAIKIDSSSTIVDKLAVDLFNYWAKQQNPTFRGYSMNILRRVSVEAQEEIDKIIKEDEKKTLGYSYMKTNMPTSAAQL